MVPGVMPARPASPPQADVDGRSQLARGIIAAQQTEIEQMEDMLAEYEQS